MKNLFNKRRLSALLGLSIDGNRVEGVVLRRPNGSLTIQNAFVVNLTLDPLTNDPELVGRELRNHLEKAEIRTRPCAVALPLNWALTLQTKLPEIPEEDIASFLQIEAERGFPYAPENLLIAHSRYRSPAGENHVTLVAIPRDHVVRLEKALKAAGLKPLTFSLGISILARPGESGEGNITLTLGETTAGFQISHGNGIVALRTLEGGIEVENGRRLVQEDAIARELRITFGHLPPDLRDAIRVLQITGDATLADPLALDLRSRYESLGIRVTVLRTYARNDFGLEVPSDALVSPAFSVAALRLAGRPPVLEFLPPKTSAWQQFSARYSSKRLAAAGAVAGFIFLIVLAAFGFQQWQLSRLNSQWKTIAPRVTELENLQQQIRRYRPWFDDSLRSLSILRQLAESFPAEGTVTAKTVEIREAGVVTCTGTARDGQALRRTLDQLANAKEVSEVKMEQLRGKTPVQFTFNFHWGEGGQ